MYDPPTSSKRGERDSKICPLGQVILRAVNGALSAPKTETLRIGFQDANLIKVQANKFTFVSESELNKMTGSLLQ